MARTVGYNYGPNKSVEYQRFNSDYFEGTDIRIYFGDIWIDEVTSLQYMMQENVAPIFGYASYTWDKVARGSRQVQGSFRINFKESYYLHSVMERLSSKIDKGASSKSSIFNKSNFKKGLNIEHLMGNSKSSSFESVADEFEKSFWGESSQFKSKTNNRGKNSYFSPDNTQKNLAEHGFNILITYGPYNESGGKNTDITADTIVGVQLTSVGKVISEENGAVQEEYQFIAKDISGNVNKLA